MRIHYVLWASTLCLKFMATGMASVPDPAGQQAAGIVAGVENGVGGRVGINEKTNRLEVRDEVGSLIDEMALGTSGKVVDVAGQEYRLSFGKDEMGRQSVLVRAGPGMQNRLHWRFLAGRQFYLPRLPCLRPWTTRTRFITSRLSVAKFTTLKVWVVLEVG